MVPRQVRCHRKSEEEAGLLSPIVRLRAGYQVQRVPVDKSKCVSAEQGPANGGVSGETTFLVIFSLLQR